MLVPSGSMATQLTLARGLAESLERTPDEGSTGETQAGATLRCWRSCRI